MGKCPHCGFPLAYAPQGEYCTNELCSYIDGHYSGPRPPKQKGAKDFYSQAEVDALISTAQSQLTEHYRIVAFQAGFNAALKNEPCGHPVADLVSGDSRECGRCIELATEKANAAAGARTDGYEEGYTEAMNVMARNPVIALTSIAGVEFLKRLEEKWAAARTRGEKNDETTNL